MKRAASFAAVASAALLASCFFMPDRPGGDANGADAPPCAGTLTWSAPRELHELESAGDAQDAPYLSPDKLQLWFTADGSNGPVVYKATRTSPTGAFGAASADVSIGDGMTDPDLFLSDDLLTAWWTHKQADHDIEKSHRGSASDPFMDDGAIAISAGSGVMFMDGSGTHYTNNEDDPTVTSDGKTLVLTVWFGGDGEPGDLAISRRDSTLVDFPEPVYLSALNTSRDECCASISGDGTLLVYAGANELDDERLFVSRWNGSAFDAGSELAATDRTAGTDNTDPALSRDGTQIIYASSTGSGARHLFEIDATCTP